MRPSPKEIAAAVIVRDMIAREIATAVTANDLQRAGLICRCPIWTSLALIIAAKDEVGEPDVDIVLGSAEATPNGA